MAITKESHLAHVIISSSDGYFIEEIYRNSKLRKTSDFLKVSYLNEKEVKYWLNNLSKESALDAYILSEAQIEIIWEHFGGSGFEISRLLGDLLRHCKNGVITNQSLEEEIEKKIIASRSFFIIYAGLDTKRQKLFTTICELLQKQDSFEENDLSTLINKNIFADQKTLQKELIELVRQNILTLDPVAGYYEIQGRSIEIGLNRYIQKIKLK